MSKFLSQWSRGALAVAISAGCAASAQAELPTQQQEQAPGWFRMMVGEYEVTALYDGHTAIDTSLLKGMEQEEILRHQDALFVGRCRVCRLLWPLAWSGREQPPRIRLLARRCRHGVDDPFTSGSCVRFSQ